MIAQELLGLYFELAKTEIEQLDAAVGNGDATAVADVLHKLVGSSITCGFVGLAEAMRVLEQQCKQGMPPDAVERIRDLTQQLFAAREPFESALAGD